MTVDRSWRTVTVQASNLAAAGESERVLTRSPAGRWIANGALRPDLDGGVLLNLASPAVDVYEFDPLSRTSPIRQRLTDELDVVSSDSV